MKSTRILLVEADKGFVDHIISLLSKMGVTRVTAVPDYNRGWASFQQAPPDICILDIGTGKRNEDGIDLAKRIRNEDRKVKFIFMTAQFTEKNYQKAKVVQPVSFMNKEISFLKLKQTIELAVPESIQARTLLSPPEPEAMLTSQMKGKQFFFRIGDVYKAIAVDEVSFFFADQKMTYARIGKRNYPTNVQLKVLEERLCRAFIRCHKKYLVNQELITSINVKEDKIGLGDESLPIGYAYRKAFLGRLNLLK